MANTANKQGCELGVRLETRVDNIEKNHDEFKAECVDVREKLFAKLDRPSWTVSIIITILVTLCFNLFQYSLSLRKEMVRYERQIAKTEERKVRR